MKDPENKLIWVKFMIGEYLEGTQGLTLVQQGIYIKYMLYYIKSDQGIEHEKRYTIPGYSGEISKSKFEQACDGVLQDIFQANKSFWVSAYLDNIKAEAKKRMKQTSSAREAKKKKAFMTSSVTEDVSAVVTEEQSELHPQKQLKKEKQITSLEDYDVSELIIGRTLLEIKKLCQKNTYLEFMGIFSQAVKDGKLEKPQNPNKALVAWFKSYVPKHKEGLFVKKGLEVSNNANHEQGNEGDCVTPTQSQESLH